MSSEGLEFPGPNRSMQRAEASHLSEPQVESQASEAVEPASEPEAEVSETGGVESLLQALENAVTAYHDEPRDKATLASVVVIAALIHEQMDTGQSLRAFINDQLGVKVPAVEISKIGAQITEPEEAIKRALAA